MQGTVERLYGLHGGHAEQPDRAVHTPGRWEGEQIIAHGLRRISARHHRAPADLS